jgi:hypothetical protein
VGHFAVTGAKGETYPYAGGGPIPLSDDKFTFGCRNQGAIAKCVEMGYKPYASGNAVDTSGNARLQWMGALHQACVRMVRADYCGDGMPHTVDGTTIDIMDYLSVQGADPTDGLSNTCDIETASCSANGTQGRCSASSTTCAPLGPEAEWSAAGATCIDVTRFKLPDVTAPMNSDGSGSDGGTGDGGTPTVGEYIAANCPTVLAAPAVSSCLSNYGSIINATSGVRASKGYATNPNFLVSTSTSTAPSLIQDFASTIAAAGF